METTLTRSSISSPSPRRRLGGAVLCLLFTLSLSLSAQTLHLHQGAVTIGIPIVTADTLTYADNGATLVVNGCSFVLSEVDSLVYSSEDLVEQTVLVNYDGTTASVFMPIGIAPYVTATVSGADVTITASSELAEEVTYVLAGSSSDGSFVQNGSYKCTMELAGLTLTNTRGGAIDIENGKRIAVLVDEGTVNTLVDGSAGSQKACFYVKGHAEFNGSGVLNITGNAKHAFSSKEYMELKRNFGTLNILGSASDGLHVDQYYEQKGGSVNISACAGDGIDCAATNDATDEQNGQILISGGTLVVDLGAAEDVKGLKCDSLLTISGGSVSVTGTGDGVKGIKTGGSLLVNESSGATTSIKVVVSGTTYHKGQDDESKTRGIKVDGDFTFDGGTISVTATGSKAKAIAVDGTYYYKSGTINCSVDAANVG